MVPQPIRLYLDTISQPSRACLIFCKVNNLPVEIVIIRLDKGEHQTPQYITKSPIGRVPLLEHGDFHVGESAAIFVYLAKMFNVPEHWYPRHDVKQEAVINSALHWHHMNLRLGAMRLVFNKVIAKLRDREASEYAAKEGQNILIASLNILDKYWIGSKGYVGGSQICIADLQFACELEQLRLLVKSAHGVDFDELLAPHPNVLAWLNRVRDHCNPHYSNAHTLLQKLADNVKAKSMSKL